jgi:hypothetical protein
MEAHRGAGEELPFNQEDPAGSAMGELLNRLRHGG